MFTRPTKPAESTHFDSSERLLDLCDRSVRAVGAIEPAGSYNLAVIGAVEIGSLIERDPVIRAGRPKIAGTGVPVMRVAGWYKMGLTPEEIATQYGHINLAQVHAALSCYHANPEEIEADLAEEEALLEQVERDSERRSL